MDPILVVLGTVVLVSFAVGVCTGYALAQLQGRHDRAKAWLRGLKDRPEIDRALADYRRRQGGGQTA